MHLEAYLIELKEQSKPHFPSRGHFRFEGDELYMRLGFSPTAGGLAITLANVEVATKHRGEGRFSHYLSIIERFAQDEGISVMIENVTNPFLPDVLSRRGYLPSTFKMHCFVKHSEQD
ncbi:hypothetical protein D3C87_686680 [compost metagenome]